MLINPQISLWKYTTTWIVVTKEKEEEGEIRACISSLWNFLRKNVHIINQLGLKFLLCKTGDFSFII